MIKGLLGKKIGMTQLFSDGESLPVTVVMAGPCFVVQRKTGEGEGYDSLQIGFIEKSKKRTNKPEAGHYKKGGTKPQYHLREFDGDSLDEYKQGQQITGADLFKEGDYVDVTGRSKGKGFAGVMKRWNFSGGPASHGSMHGRAPGSIGQCSSPSKVFKGVKMAGHMGNRMITTQNLCVVGIVPDENLLLIKGSVPGPMNGVIEIRRSKKKG
ncbi:MAG: 50S ribosomal protein L3 [Deltaproteobacteria bacterium]|nr:50S ribosomal protein L3 [Deltaproteobacteria bacterium]